MANDVPAETEATVTCPVCGAPMSREVVYRSVVHVCEDHGAWLERGQLESIVRSVQARGIARSRQSASKVRSKTVREGVVLGWIWGPLGFLFK